MSKAKRNHIKAWRVANLYAKGLGVQKIADKIGASYMGVRLRLIREGLLKKPLPPSIR
jgi:hypothetical protein